MGPCKRKKEGIFILLIFLEVIFFNIFVLSRCIVYWIHFQNKHVFTYQKTLLHSLFCLFLKLLKAFGVSLKSVLLLLLVNFVSGLRVKLMNISLIVNIWSSFTHLHGFLLPVQLPYFIGFTFFVCTNRINLLNLELSSNRLVIIARTCICYLNKKVYHFTERRLSGLLTSC